MNWKLRHKPFTSVDITLYLDSTIAERFACNFSNNFFLLLANVHIGKRSNQTSMPFLMLYYVRRNSSRKYIDQCARTLQIIDWTGTRMSTEDWRRCHASWPRICSKELIRARFCTPTKAKLAQRILQGTSWTIRWITWIAKKRTFKNCFNRPPAQPYRRAYRSHVCLCTWWCL